MGTYSLAVGAWLQGDVGIGSRRALGVAVKARESVTEVAG